MNRGITTTITGRNVLTFITGEMMALYYQAVLRKKVEVNTKKGGSSDVNLHLILQFSIITIKMSQHIV